MSELWVARVGAIRVRADVERKRHFGLSPTARPDEEAKREIYSSSASAVTYAKLLATATDVLEAGYPVVLDATYLKHQQRRAAFGLASQLGVGFGILDCSAEPEVLRQRLIGRRATDNDASDADLQVLADQLANSDPLDEVERRQVIDFPAAQTSRVS